MEELAVKSDSSDTESPEATESRSAPGDSAIGAHSPSENRFRICIGCGRQIGWEAKACAQCGMSFVMEKRVSANSRRFWNARTAGVLITAAGLLCLFASVSLTASAYDIIHSTQTYPTYPYPFNDYSDQAVESANDVLPIAALLIVASIASVIGGVASIARRFFRVGVIGGVTSPLGISYLLMVDMFHYRLDYEMSLFAGLISFPMGIVGLLAVINAEGDFAPAKDSTKSLSSPERTSPKE